MSISVRPVSAGDLARDNGVLVRPLREEDLPTADHIMRLAFGTFLGLPDPLTFMGDADYVRTRWAADPAAAFGAEVGGELVGSNFATKWGSVAFFGPLTVRPDFWDRGVAQQLLEATMELFERWEIRHAGLFTFAESPKHVALYQKFGFWPRFLTPIMSKPVEPTAGSPHWSRYSEVSEDEREECLLACRELTDTIYEGLDLEREIRAVQAQGLGESVLLWDDSKLLGFAVCHCGPGSEAGSGACYIKFGAARPGAEAAKIFGRLLDACEALASVEGMSRLIAGVNTARRETYRRMLARGFRADILQGVTMHRPDEPGYDRPDVYAVDDWR
jgi:GNAT superfamily N-acetyltransferase